MEQVLCRYCKSENVYFSKKKQKYCCEDCEEMFELEKKFLPQKVFISYGHDKNRTFVEEIKNRIKERGHNPWIDSAEIMPGDDWRRTISRGINSSDDFLAFVSNHSIRKPGVCLDEIAIALSIPECIIQTIVLERNINPPNSIISNQWLDFSKWEEIKQQGEAAWNSWLDKNMEILFQVIESQDNTTRSGEIIEIKKKLNPITPDLLLKILMRDEIVQRKWLLELVDKWIHNSSRVLVIVGGPGAGKSIFCALLSNYIYNVNAMFFIDWKNVDTQNVKEFIVSIAFQLACHLNDYREKLIKILFDYKMENKSSYTVCEQLLIKPLSELIDGQREKTVIVVDALDEIRYEYAKFIDILQKLIEESPEWIKWIITSRPEVSVLRRMDKYNPLYLNLYEQEIRHDIVEFIGMYFKDKELVNAIFEKCEGSFTYVNELIKNCRGKEVTSSMIHEMPKSIAELYYVNFERIFENKYDDFYKKLLSLIIYAYEPINILFLANFFRKTEKEIKSKLEILNSYINIIEIDGIECVSVVHKSLIDWITGTTSQKYFIDFNESHALFANYTLDLLRRNEMFDKYITEYGYRHIKEAKIWIDLEYNYKCKLLEKLIEASKQYGFIRTEKKLLDIYKADDYNTKNWAMYALDYSIRVNEETSRCLCDLVYHYSLEEKNPYERYQMVEKVAIALFYLGEDEKSYKLLLKEKENKQLFIDYPELEATWNHSISLSAHDMDFNEQVVETAQLSANLYMKQNRNYDYFISLVNLFDAYMGSGDLENAEYYARKVMDLNSEKYFIHVDDILKICYGNLLQTQGRIMESLQWYEEGLQLAKEIQSWDYLYGSIWRELAIAKFGDPSCLKRLEIYIEESKKQAFTYLVSLGGCFYILSSWLLHSYDIEKMRQYENEVVEIGLSGHCIQTIMAMLLCNNKLVEEDKEEILSVLAKHMSVAQGVKGLPEVVHCFWKMNDRLMSAENKSWYEKYIVPVIKYQKDYRENLIKRRTDALEPYLKKTPCLGCEAKCCYDGVYLRSSDEEKRIVQLMQKYPECFMHIPEEYIVNGNWPGMESDRKTAVKEHNYLVEDYPTHFEKTTCVFTMDNGECLLQRVATDHQLHPWFAKPCACWSFPLRGIDKYNGTIIAPPDCGEQDPDYVDENYPGYSTFLPCGKAINQFEIEENDVHSWTDLFEKEIEYYDFLISKQKL